MSITEETRRESYEKLDSNTLRMKIVSLLKEKDRAMSAGEIARIMSGTNITENLYNSAKELLDRSKQ